MLRERTLFGPVDLIAKSIARLKEFESQACAMNPAGYWVAFSGGKDSIVLLDLVRRSGVKHETHYNITTVDPPELTCFIREYYPEVKRDRPAIGMFQLIIKNRMPPTRTMRYCCRVLKERGGSSRFVITGIRWAESTRRQQRRMTEVCFNDSRKRYLHPLIEWTDADVWQYIRENQLPYCRLYDEGFTRIGCILCPMAERDRHLHAIRWPKFKAAYIHAFDLMVINRKADGLVTEWENGQAVWDWWMQDTKKDKTDPDQTVLFE